MRSALSALLLVLATATASADTPKCQDGTASEGGRGACSHHGGFAKAKAGSARTTVCRDGTKTKVPGKGACSHNGGVGPATHEAARSVRCTDGSIALTTGKDTCARHGGRAHDTMADRERHDQTSQARVPTRNHRSPIGARCSDGTTSTIMGRGACSHHGGIDATNGSLPTARCNDGTLSYSEHHSGTCSNHGGVAEWVIPTP